MSRQGCRSTRGQRQCPQIPPPIHPTTHARAGSQPGPQAERLGLPLRLQPATGGQNKESRADSIDGGLVPLNCLHLLFLFLSDTQTFKHSVPVFVGAWWKRLSADGCLLGPRVLVGGKWGTPVRLFMC
ncbi:hypothetical protein Q8A73_002305 [Channa argus]|nr:hypothetical protein Q8A73_002305 [Channa argus]